MKQDTFLTLGEPSRIMEYTSTQDSLHHGQVHLILGIGDGDGHVVLIIGLELELLGAGDIQGTDSGADGVAFGSPLAIGGLGKGKVELGQSTAKPRTEEGSTTIPDVGVGAKRLQSGRP